MNANVIYRLVFRAESDKVHRSIVHFGVELPVIESPFRNLFTRISSFSAPPDFLWSNMPGSGRALLLRILKGKKVKVESKHFLGVLW